MIRTAVAADQAQIFALYKEVAAVPGGLARTAEEMSLAYVAAFMDKAATHGLELVWEEDGRILGEIHASRAGIACFAHVLGDLTIAVAPQAQGRGVGRALFAALLDDVKQRQPGITRVELFMRESNTRARKLYAALGFVEEGRLPGRVRDPDGRTEADLVMGWLRNG